MYRRRERIGEIYSDPYDPSSAISDLRTSYYGRWSESQ